MPRSFSSLSRLTAASSAAAALLFTACAEPTSAPTRAISPGAASNTQSPELNNQPGQVHYFHVRSWSDDDPSNNAGGRGGANSAMVYHGGPVLQSGTKVAAVYWASTPIFVGGPAVGTHGSGSSDGSLVGFFLRNLGGSPYFNINTTYTDGSGRAIANSVSYTQYWANNTSAPSGTQSVSDAQMVAMLQSGFNSGALTYDASTVYAILTSGKVNLGGGFGSSYCAYHTHGTVTINGVSRTVLYAAMPYNYAYPSACTSGLSPANGSADPGADYEVNTLAHEVEEATTDMLGTAWYDRRGYENADKCAWTWGTTYTSASGGAANMNLGGKDFLVQRNWVNVGSGGCAQSY